MADLGTVHPIAAGLQGIQAGIQNAGQLYGLMRQKKRDEMEESLMPLRKQALEQEIDRGKTAGEKAGLELQSLKDYNTPLKFDEVMQPFRESDKIGTTIAEEIATKGGYLDPTNRTIKKGDLAKVRELSSTPEMMKQRALLNLQDINAQLKTIKPEDPAFAQLTEKKNYLEKMYKLEEDFEAVPVWNDKTSSWEWVNKKNGQPVPTLAGKTPKEVQVELLKPKTPVMKQVPEKDAAGNPTGRFTWQDVRPVEGQAPQEAPAPASERPSNRPITETSPDGKRERTVVWDAKENKVVPMPGSAGAWHAAKSQVISITKEMDKAEGFSTWTPEAKEQVFQFNMITGKEPANTKGFAAGDRRAYAKEYAEWQVKKGFKASDVALMQSDYKAGDMSLKNMTKQEAPMQAFVGNINRQIEKVKELYSNNDRVGIRLIDLPVRELRLRAKGSGDEAVKASYLLEISNEIGKLSSGSSGSVQQLSDSQQKQWAKVHDPNLSLKEIMKVVDATREQANMRLSSWKEAKQTVRENIKGLGGSINTSSVPATGSTKKPLSSY